MTETRPDSPATRPSRARAVAFRLAAIALGLMPVILLEAALRFFEVGHRMDQRDPLAGFNRQLPLFERVGDVYRTVHSRQPFFNPQEFLAEKPAGGFRVFCLGGSTIYGHPYESDTAMPKWLELELRGRDPRRSVEVVNCGGVSYASYRLKFIVREVLQYQPDAIVLATGENEFLEDRTYTRVKQRSTPRRWIEDRAFSLHTVALAAHWFHGLLNSSETVSAPGLSPEVKPRLDDDRGGYASYHRDDAWRRQVVAQFEDSVREMIADCRAARVPIILITLGSNLRDCPPYKSEHKPGLTVEQEAAWQSAFDAATASETADLKQALAYYAQAEAIDAEHALLAFRMARCWDQLGVVEKARAYYRRAKDLDVCPLRMLDEVYQLHHTIATATETPLVDIRQVLEARAPDGIPGNDLYLDHVHPNIGGSQLMARAVAEKFAACGIFAGSTWPEAARRAAYERHIGGLKTGYFTNGRRRVEWLENWARRQRLEPETRPRDARGYLHHGFRMLDLGDEEQSWIFFMTAMKANAATAKELVAHAHALRDQGRSESGRRLLERLGDLMTDPAIKLEIQRAATNMTAGR